MSWQDFWLDLAAAVLPVLGGWLVYLVHRMAVYYSEKWKSPAASRYLKMFDITVEAVVKALMPVAEDLKAKRKGGSLTREEVRAIKREALERVERQLSATAKKFLTTFYDDLPLAIDQHIEAKLYDLKRAGAGCGKSGEVIGRMQEK